MTSTWIHLYLPGTPRYVFSAAVPTNSGNCAAQSGTGLKKDDEGRPKVLVLDDEKIIADSVAAILNMSGFDAIARYDGGAALEFIHQECPDILLSDVVMPRPNGLQVASKVQSHCPGTRIILISGNAATPDLLEQTWPGEPPFEILAKPIHPTHLLEILRS